MSKVSVRFIPLALSLFSLSPSALALSDADMIQGLESLGEWEAAYPLAYSLAEKQDDYNAWRNLAERYAQYDEDGQAYLKAWVNARELNSKGVYDDFIKLRSPSPYNALAVHGIYQIASDLNTIDGYRDFIRDFPNAPEAVQAWLRVHEIAYQRARADDRPEVYDAFVQLFPNARQTSMAIEAAYDAERRAIEDELSGGVLDLKQKFFAGENKERVSRRLYNEARDGEKSGDDLVRDRKYHLLGLGLFKDTKVYTELLDREELNAYRGNMERYQQRIINGISNMRQAVVQEVRAQGDRLEDAIADHNRRIEAQFRDMHNSVNQRFSQVNEEFNRVYGHVNAQTGAIADSIRAQTSAMESAMSAASIEQEVLFNRANEANRKQQYKNRHCTDVLRRHGNYPIFSGCP